MKNSKKIIPLPYKVYFYTALILVLIGLSNYAYLAISHYRVYTDITYSSFCAISKSINCDTVSQSQYSILFGIPVSVWGIIGYTFVLILFLFSLDTNALKKRMWSILCLIFGLYSTYSIILAYISILYIKSYCLLCITGYGINFFLVYYTWLTRKRFDDARMIKSIGLDISYLWLNKKKFFPMFAFYICIVAGLVIYYPSYWIIAEPQLTFNMDKGTTKEGYPWVGAKNPKLVIMEFTDYQCFQCKKMHYYIRQLVNENPDEIRLIHRHFPMDNKYNPLVKNPFHIGSGIMALFAEYANSQGKFWEMNDALFNLSRTTHIINLKKLAKKTGLDYQALSNVTKDKIIRHRVKHDIAIGIRSGINGTPGYIIDNEVYLGNIPPEIFKIILD